MYGIRNSYFAIAFVMSEKVGVLFLARVLHIYVTKRFLHTAVTDL